MKSSELLKRGEFNVMNFRHLPDGTVEITLIDLKRGRKGRLKARMKAGVIEEIIEDDEVVSMG